MQKNVGAASWHFPREGSLLKYRGEMVVFTRDEQITGVTDDLASIGKYKCCSKPGPNTGNEVFLVPLVV